MPVVLIVAIVTWSYYAYIVHLCIFTVISDSGSTVSGVILAAVYHVFLVPFLMSYWQTVWTKPGKVPPNYSLSVSEVDIIETASEPLPALENLIASKDLAVVTRSIQGEVRYCSECSHIKVILLIYRISTNNSRSRLVATPLRNQAITSFLLCFYVAI